MDSLGFIYLVEVQSFHTIHYFSLLVLFIDMNNSEIPLSNYPLDSARSDKCEIAIPEHEGAPSLGYDIASKKRSIAISSLTILIINGIAPALLFYILEYGMYHGYQCSCRYRYLLTIRNDNFRHTRIKNKHYQYRRDHNDFNIIAVAVATLAAFAQRRRTCTEKQDGSHVG